MAVAVAALAASGLAACSHGRDRSAPTTTAPAALTTVTTAGWEVPTDDLEPVPEPPAGDAGGPVTMLEDQALLYAGEYGTLDEGQPPPQLFDPDTGTWTVLPEPLFAHRLETVQVAPIAGGFLLLGEACDGREPIESTDSAVSICTPGQIEAARYDIGARTWHEVEMPGAFDGGSHEPGSAFVLASRPAAGEVLVGWKDTTWRYQADGDRWARIDAHADAPDRGVCGTDTGFATIDAPYGATSTTEISARRLSDDGSWEEFPVDLPAQAAAESSILVCTPGSLVVLGRPELGIGGTTSYALAFDVEAGTWSAVAVPPPMERELVSAPVDDGAVVVARNDEEGPTTWHYVEAEQRWEPSDLRLRIGNLSLRRDGTFVGDADIFGRRNVTTRTAIRLT